jgi:uncharacterized RDD family membrane protein YckC
MKTFQPPEVTRLNLLKGKPLASFWFRGAAFVIDFAIAFLLFTIVLIIGGRLFVKIGWIDADAQINLKFDLAHWYSILAIVIYFGFATYFGKGKTPGKWIFRIRVISLIHDHLSLWHCIERSLGYGASALEFGFGFIQYFLYPNRRTLHDRIAETIVVQEEKKIKVKKPKPVAKEAEPAVKEPEPEKEEPKKAE